MFRFKFLVIFGFISWCLWFVNGDNYTAAYKNVPFDNVRKHEPRFLTFNTDDGDLSVDLEFAVPFISIPVKKTVNAAMGLYSGQPIANLNIGSLFLAAGVFFAAVFIIPFFSSFFFKHMFFNPSLRSNEPNETWRILTIIDQALIENNIDTTSCMQRTMCWLAKNSRNNLDKGEATSQDKIMDGLFTNHWINQLMEGSAIQSAIHYGLGNNSCAVLYKNCKINQNTIQAFAKKIAKYLKQ